MPEKAIDKDQNAPSVIERKPPIDRQKREVLFASVLAGKNRSEVYAGTENVLQHSVEDGLILAERAGLSRVELAEAVLSAGFTIKHPEVFTELVNIITEEKVSRAIDNNPLNRPIFSIMASRYDELLRARKTGEWDQFAERAQQARDAQTKTKVISKVNDYYAPLLITREFAPQTQPREYPLGERVKGFRGEIRQLKSAEELADEALGQYEKLIRPAYYAATVEDILKKYLTAHQLAGEPANLGGNYFTNDTSKFFTVKEVIEAECERLSIPFGEIEPRLNAALYTSVTAGIKGAEAERGLAKKLNKSLEASGRKVELKADRYEVVDLENKEEEEKAESDAWDDKTLELAEFKGKDKSIGSGFSFDRIGDKIFVILKDEDKTKERQKIWSIINQKVEMLSEEFDEFTSLTSIFREGGILTITGQLKKNGQVESRRVPLDVDKIRRLTDAEKKKQDNIISVEGGESRLTQERDEEYFDFPNKRVKVVKVTPQRGNKQSEQQFFEVDGKIIGGMHWRPYYHINQVQYNKESKELKLLGYRSKEEKIQQLERGVVVIVDDDLARELEGKKVEKKESMEIDGKFLGDNTWQLGGMKIRLMEINNGDECVFVDADTSHEVTEEFPAVYDVKDITYENGHVFYKCKRISDNLQMYSGIEIESSFQGQGAGFIKKIEGGIIEKKKSKQIEGKLISLGEGIRGGFQVGGMKIRRMDKNGSDILMDHDTGDFITDEFTRLNSISELYYEDGELQLIGKDQRHIDIAMSLKVQSPLHMEELRARFIKKIEGDDQEKKESDFEKFEDKSLDYLEKILSRHGNNGSDDYFVASNLAVFDSKRAHELRADLLRQKGPFMDSVLAGLAGIDSEEAWRMRDEVFNNWDHESGLVISLSGLDSDRAWQMRAQLLERMENDDYQHKEFRIHILKNRLVKGLAGLNSERAWKMRDDFFAGKYKVEYESQFVSLRGLDNERAWEMRDKLEGNVDIDKGKIFESLAGLDSIMAWRLRDGYMTSHSFIDDMGFVKMDEVDVIVESLAGLDNNRAWQMRDEIVRKTQKLDRSNQVKRRILEYCTGLNSARAWELRDEIMDEDGRSLAKSFANPEYTYLLLKLKENENNERELTLEEQNQLRTLNLLHHPTLEGIQQEFGGVKGEIEANLARKKSLQDMVSGSPVVARVLSKLIGKQPKLFIETMAAKRGRALTKVFAEKIALKIFPEIAAARQQESWRGFPGYAGLEGKQTKQGKQQPENYLERRFEGKLAGGGAEQLTDEREIMEFRDPIEGIVVSNILGQYRSENKYWGQIGFNVDTRLSEPVRETTATIPNVKKINQVSLPKPLEAKIINERVKGFDATGKEYDLEVVTNVLGESAVVNKPKAVEKIVYSLAVSEAPEPMRNLSGAEYLYYLKQLQGIGMRFMSTELAGLPDDLDHELLAAIAGKSPKEQVMSIERLVRDLGYYDNNNQEVSPLKDDKSLEEQLYIMEQRLEELKQKNPGSTAYEGKRFAGVCADFAQVAAIFLRRAGFPSGVITGFRTDNKKICVKNAHATAFVLWPDNEGHNRVISIDGTPDGVEGVSLPSLAQRESKAVSQEKKLANLELAEIQKIIDNLNHVDVETVRKMSNGELERTLNSILKYQVKESQLVVIERLFEFYWYARSEKSALPIAKLDLANPYQRLEAMVELTGAVERQRKRILNQPEKDNVPAGNKLMQMMQGFLSRFEAVGVSEDKYAAIDLMEKIIELVQNDLTEVEKKAAYATIAYLKAKNILGDKK